MAYLLSSTEIDHCNLIDSLVQSATKQEQDVILVSSEGHRVFTHKFLLSLYSSLCRDLVADIFPGVGIGISIPASFESLLNLVKILTHGEVQSEDYESLAEVKSAAASMGIDIKNWNLVTDDSEKEEEWVITSILPSSDNLQAGQEVGKDSEATECTDLCTNMVIKEEVTEEVTATDESDANKSDKGNKRKRFARQFPHQNLNLKCKDCEKVFNETRNLNRHALTHSGIKNFSCNECEMKFSRNDKLKQHLIIVHSVTGRESYGCGDCDKTFKRKDHLSRHNARAHGI